MTTPPQFFSGRLLFVRVQRISDGRRGTDARWALFRSLSSPVVWYGVDLDAEPESPPIAVSLGEVLQLSGKHRGARDVWRPVRRTHPDNPDWSLAWFFTAPRDDARAYYEHVRVEQLCWVRLADQAERAALLDLGDLE